jgi:hypothetical protein
LRRSSPHSHLDHSDLRIHLAWSRAVSDYLR